MSVTNMNWALHTLVFTQKTNAQLVRKDMDVNEHRHDPILHLDTN